MITTEDEARDFCAQLFNPDAMQRFARFAELLAKENANQNLVSAGSLENVWQRHILDSLQLLLLAMRVPERPEDSDKPFQLGPWLDLGTGAGPPGLLIAIADPDMEVHLVESRKKRVEWLEAMVSEFGLSNCRVHGARLQDVASFDAAYISARAFAPMPKLLNLSARFSTQSTLWLLPKGRSAQTVLNEGFGFDRDSGSLNKMFHVEQSITDPEAGILVGRGAVRG